jgi:hypothetical protein
MRLKGLKKVSLLKAGHDATFTHHTQASVELTEYNEFLIYMSTACKGKLQYCPIVDSGHHIDDNLYLMFDLWFELSTDAIMFKMKWNK